MSNGLTQLISHNYGIDVTGIKLVSDQGEAKVYMLESPTGKYALKEFDDIFELKHERDVCDMVAGKGVNLPKIYDAKSGRHIVHNNGLTYILYDFIEGTRYELNTAPEWFLMKQVQTLGQIQSALRDYKQLPMDFEPSFFSQEEYTKSEHSALEKLRLAEENEDKALVQALNERLKHIRRISAFEFDCGRLTYVNSHGDFYINQIIVRDGEFVVIDWSDPYYLPACYEVLMSYTYAAPECKGGVIDVERFKPVLREYLKYVTLSQYDIKMMPYLLYAFCVFGSFSPPYDDLSADHLRIAKHTANLANWLHDNVEKLSDDLCVTFCNHR